jgi:hypothetical protein
MADLNERLTTRWKDTANLMLGIWLGVSPWVLSYTGHTTAHWNAHLVGLVIAVAALAVLISFQQWEEWVNTALAAWLIISPFILGFSTLSVALWNQLIVGVLVGALSLWSVMTDDTRLTTRT